MYTIKHVSGMGRAVFATQDIPSGSRVFIDDVIKTPKNAVPDYNFTYNDTHDCICLGHGELFNHSDDPNIVYEVVEDTMFPIMMFTTSKDIKEGEQMFIDYRQDDPNIDLKKVYNIQD